MMALAQGNSQVQCGSLRPTVQSTQGLRCVWNLCQDLTWRTHALSLLFADNGRIIRGKESREPYTPGDIEQAVAGNAREEMQSGVFQCFEAQKGGGG